MVFAWMIYMDENPPARNLAQKILFLLKGSVAGFVDDKVMKLSAALAYYTIFSMGPMLMTIIMLCSVFLGKEAIEGTIEEQISSYVGDTAAAQIEEIIGNAAVSGNSTLAMILGVGMLVFGATGVFVEIQDSINFIWGLRARPAKGWLKLLLNRLLSFSLVIGLGFVLMVSMLLESVIGFFNEKLLDFFPEAAIVGASLINTGLNFLITATLFAIIFKVLPDARIKWKDVAVGACFTALLFLLGKLAIGFYMSQVDMSSSYGVAGSLVVVLLWVYYSAVILYFGAEFTLVYAQEYGQHILPDSYAVWIERVEVQHNGALETAKGSDSAPS